MLEEKINKSWFNRGRALALGLAFIFLNYCPFNEVKAETVSKPAKVEQVVESEQVKFVNGLNLDNLENYVSNMRYVPFNRFSQVKPAKTKVDVKHIADLVKLVDIYNADQVSEKIENKTKFIEMIDKTSKKLGYKNIEKWNIPGFIRWNNNLVRFWSSYHHFMVSNSNGVGIDVNGDGIGDRINSQFFLKLPRKMQLIAKANPSKFVKSVEEEADRIDNASLDKLLEKTKGEEGKLMLVCRNLATLNKLIFENTKERNPNLSNVYCLRVENQSHMWNLFVAVNEEGTFYTSVDPTFSENGQKEFTKYSQIDFTSNSHLCKLVKRGHVHLMAGSIYRRNGLSLTALNLYLKFVLNNPTKIQSNEITNAIGDAWRDLKSYKNAYHFYKLSNDSYAIFQQGFCLYKIKDFDASNQCLKRILNLFDKNNPSKYCNNSHFDEALSLTGVNYFKLKKYDDAIKSFELNLKISPRFRDVAYTYLYNSYLAKGEIKKAAVIFNEIKSGFSMNNYKNDLINFDPYFYY